MERLSSTGSYPIADKIAFAVEVVAIVSVQPTLENRGLRHSSGGAANEDDIARDATISGKRMVWVVVFIVLLLSLFGL